jgi:predicted DNA-binding transcriptional regulator YafY
VLRDAEALSAAGIPVYTERGRGGGIRLLDTYRTGMAGWSRDEGVGLAVGQPRLAGDLGLGDALDMAIEKITGAGGSRLRGGFEQGRAHIVIDVDPWMRSGEQVPMLPRIHDAVIRRRRLDLDYRDGESRARKVTVDPLGLVAKAGVWYLVGDAPPRTSHHDPAAREAALFRVSRVHGCEIRPDPCARPDDFDLAAAWTALRGRVEAKPRDLAVTVRLDPAVASMARRLLAQHIRDDVDRCTLRLAFVTIEHAVGSLLAFGSRIEVVDPEPVRAAMRSAAEDVVTLYASPTAAASP